MCPRRLDQKRLCRSAAHESSLYYPCTVAAYFDIINNVRSINKRLLDWLHATEASKHDYSENKVPMYDCKNMSYNINIKIKKIF